MTANLIVLFSLFSVLALLRVPVGLSMLAAGIGYLFFAGLDVGLMVDQVVGRLFGSYTLVAIPMFIFAANVMNGAQITQRIVNVAAYLLGRLPGGMAHANVASSVVFSGMSGSAVADVAGPGRVMTKMMVDGGKYSPAYACAVTAASSTIGPIIPPSIPVVIYALVSNASVGALFLGGVIPGLLMALSLMALIAAQAYRRGFEKAEVTVAGLSKALLDAFLPLLMPVILLTAIYGGIATATEAAAMAAFYALILAILIYRTLSLDGLVEALIATVKESAIVGVTIAGAFMIGFAITNEQFPALLADWVLNAEMSALTLLIAISVLFLLLGCILDVSVMLLILVPLLIPAVVYSGIDLVHFGIVIIINIMIGLITPPYGLLLFVMANLTDTPLKEIMIEIIPFVAVLIGVLFLLVLFPQLVLWLPQTLGY